MIMKLQYLTFRVTSSGSQNPPAFSPQQHKCAFDICFIPADSANVVQPQSYGLRTGRQKLGICVFPLRKTEMQSFCLSESSVKEALRLHHWHPGHPFVLHFRIQVSVMEGIVARFMLSPVLMCFNKTYIYIV